MKKISKKNTSQSAKKTSILELVRNQPLHPNSLSSIDSVHSPITFKKPALVSNLFILPSPSKKPALVSNFFKISLRCPHTLIDIYRFFQTFFQIFL